MVGGEVDGHTGDAVEVGVLGFGGDGGGKSGTSGAGLFVSAPRNDLYSGTGRSGGSGGGFAETGPRDGQSVGARFFRKRIDGGGVAAGVCGSGGGTE